MSFCPECRDEFQSWVTVCPDCQVALVDRLEEIPQPVPNNEPLVHVATAPNEAIAGLWAGILENNGILCVIKSDNLRSAQYSLLYNQYQSVYVLKSVARRAKTILQPFKREMKIYAHSSVVLLPFISRILLILLIAASIIAGGGWGSYLFGMIILWVSYKLKGRQDLDNNVN